MIVADTNIVSELMRQSPDGRVLRWAESLPASEITICVVTVEEVERGLRRLPAGRRQAELQRRWYGLLAAYDDSILVYDSAAATATAAVLAEAEAGGRTIALADAQIAGICLVAKATLATRNLRDFAGIADLEVVDPFAA